MMKTVDFSRDFGVEVVGSVRIYKVVDKSGKYLRGGRTKSSRLYLRGVGTAAYCCDKFPGWPGSQLSSLVASANYSSLGAVGFSSKVHHSYSNLGAVCFGGGKSCCLKNELFPRSQWEESQHNVGNYVSRSRTSGTENSRSSPVAEILIKRSCAVAGEGDCVGEEVHESELQGGGLYRPFADFAVRELGRRSDVTPLLLKDEFRNMVARDGLTTIENNAFASSKIRYFRSTYINAGPSMQVLNVAGFSRPEYDIPIFCADFFSTSTRNIIVLDLNPLYSTSTNRSYKERYYDELMVVANKHAKVLPWGDKLTAESMQFFSPLVLWTKAHGQDLNQTLYPAFQDYILVWLSILDRAQPSLDPLAVVKNQEAQHRYLTWRATKDPGRALLARLYGEEFAERYIEEYLFSGVKSLGTKSFLDYFPEYRTEDNTINKQRSMIGKSFSTRPWDERGNLCLN